MIERGDGHIINVATWGVLTEATPLFAAYNSSKAALSAFSRVIETEWAQYGVHSTTLYYPLVATPMIAPTKAYVGMPALSAAEAAEWMVTAARTRPVRIAPRMAVSARALDLVAPGWLNGIMRTVAAFVIADALVFISGLAWLGLAIGWPKAVAVGLAPFLLGEAIKIGLATALLQLWPGRTARG